MFIDTHTHLNFKAFGDDWEKVVNESVSGGVKKMLVVGTDLDSSKRAVEMAKENKALYASVGVHPHHARGFRKFSNFQFSIFKKIEQLAAHPKVVAIGEVGLDYHKYEKTKYEIEKSEKEWKKLKIVQKQLLGMQIELAKKLNKPLIIHSREAKDEVLDTVNHFSKSDGKMPWGVFHCFEGRASYMKHVLEAGFYISFTGNIVYNKDRAQVAKKVPLDKLLLETDCPYFAKASKGKPCLRSTPCDVKILADFHAKVRGVSLSEVESQTTKNAKALFGI